MNEMEWMFFSLVLIWGILVLAHYVRKKSQTLARLFLPGSIIAGVLTLLLGPDVLGKVASNTLAEDSFLTEGLIPEQVLSVWEVLPGIFINVVFAALFLGKLIPGIKSIWRRSAPVITYGQIIAWGQYVVGFILAILILEPFFDMNPMAGALIEIGFEGGHGTAAGMIPVFNELGFSEGADLALGIATAGLVLAILTGTVLINWAARTGKLNTGSDALTADEVPSDMSELLEEQPVYRKTSTNHIIDPLSFHLGLIGIAIFIGWCLLEGLILLEEYTWGSRWDVHLMTHVPLFPLAMIGGVILQIIISRYLGSHTVDRHLIERIAGTALDIIIVAALATLSLDVIGEHWVPFLLLVVTGVAWNILGFIYLAPRLIPRYWFENGIPNFGQSMGMTVTGILLFRMTDPENKSGGLENFGYKQLLFEPVVGGGLFTASVLPLVAQFGAPVVLVITAVLMLAWILFGFFVMKPSLNRGSG